MVDLFLSSNDTTTVLRSDGSLVLPLTVRLFTLVKIHFIINAKKKLAFVPSQFF